MLRELCKALVVLNWITPAEGLVRRILTGPAHTFLVHENCGLSGHQITSYLRQCGIRSHTHMIRGDYWMFRVQRAQQDDAYRVLEDAGIPVENPPRSVRSPVREQTPRGSLVRRLLR